MKFWKLLRQKFSAHPFFWLALLLTALVVIGLLPFLFRSGHLVYGDVTEGIFSQNIARKYFWTFDDNVGPTLVEKSRLPLFTLFWSLFSFLQLPDEALVKIKIITLFVLSIWAFVVAVKITRKHFTDDSAPPSPQFLLATALGTLVFLFNPWMMNRLNHFFLYFGSVNLPLVFALYLDFLLVSTSSLKKLLGLLLIVAITSATPHIIVIELLVMAIMTVVVLVFSSERGRVLRRVVVIGGMGVIGGILLNSYWLLPYISSLGGAGASPDKVLTVEVLRLLSQYSQPFNTVRLLGYWWPTTKYFLDFNLPLYYLGIAGSLVLPVAFLVYVGFGFKRLAVKVLGAVAVIGIFLSSFTPASEALYRYLMFSSPLASLGWVWREIDKLGLVLVLVFSLGFVYLVSLLLTHRFYILVALSFLLLGIFCYPHTAFTLYYDFAPQYVPKAFFLADGLLAADKSDFNVVWYPKVVDPVWSKNIDEPGNFAIYSSSEPTLGYSSDTAALLNYALDPRNAAKINVAKFLDLLGVKYLVIRQDARSTSQAALIGVLDSQPAVARIAEYDFLVIYQNQLFSGLLKPLTSQIVSTLGLETLKYLDQLGIETSQSALTLADSGTSRYPLVPVTKVLLENGDSNDLVLAALSEYFIYPFNATFRGDSSRYWSRATTSDQLHGELTPLLSGASINNQQLDFRGGVVVASDQKFFKSEEFLATVGTSPSQNLTINWREASPSGQNTYWSVLPSEPLPLSAGQSLYLEFNTAESPYAAEANLRLDFFSRNQEFLRSAVAIPTFNNYQGVITAPDQTAYVVVQSLARAGYPAKISKLRLVDVTALVSRLSLAFKSAVDCKGDCSVWVRTLDSSAGGGIRLAVGATIFDLNTYSSYNRFNWHYLGEVSSLSSNLDLELTNLGGFEVVNAIAVVPAEKLAAAQVAVTKLLATSQTFIVTNPDTALPWQKTYLGVANNSVSWPISYPTTSLYNLWPVKNATVVDTVVTVAPPVSADRAATLKIDPASAPWLSRTKDGYFIVGAGKTPPPPWLVVASVPVPISGGHDYKVSGRLTGENLQDLHLKIGEQAVFAPLNGSTELYTFSQIIKITDWSKVAPVSFLVRGEAVGARFKVLELTVEDVADLVAAPVILAEDKKGSIGDTGGATLNRAIKIVKNDPTNYSVTLAQASTSAFLTFAKPFDSDWRLGGQKPLLTNIIFNGWELPASSSSQLTVVYGPQAYFVWGSIVSLLTAVGVGVVYLVLRKRVG